MCHRRREPVIFFILVSLLYTIRVASTQAYLDSLPTLREVFPELVTEPGRYVSLKCTASGSPAPSILWRLDGLPIADESSASPNQQRLQRKDFAVGSFTVGSLVVSHVNISVARVEEGGLYECEARSPLGSSLHRARLNVMGKPVVRAMAEAKGIAGQRLVLHCPVAGYPIDSISWHKGPHRLPVNKRQEVFENGTLIIHDLQKAADDGSYTCRASGGQEEAQSAVKVVIRVGPMIDPFDFPKNIRVGMRARLVCSILQGDPPFAFSWTREGRRLEPASLSIGVRSDDFSSDLTFPRLAARHNGNYSCTVKNDVASVSHSALLIVDVPPFWKVEPKDASVVGGANVLLDCLAEGVPSPVITWERAAVNAPRFYSPISSGPHFEVYANGSLLVKNAGEEDGAFFLCQASNTIGPGLSKVVSLTVHVPPRFTTKFQSEAVRLGEAALLKCEAIGDNPMTIAWHIDKQAIASTEDARFERREEASERRLHSTLKIASVRRRDSALFTCLVSNAFGADEMNIRLIVQEPPEAPRDVKLLEVGSHSAKLTWTAPFNGNNQITKYWITCHPKEMFETASPPNGGLPSAGAVSPRAGHINVSVDSVPAEDGTTALVRSGLRPASSFLCTIRAENDIGLSPASLHVELVTEEEAPGAPPLQVRAEPVDARSARISWKAPERSFWNGLLKGYYIGYKVRETDDQYLYKTLELSPTSNPEINSVVLAGLRPFTEYVVLVQAYNSMGTGPRSDEISLTTSEDVPSQAPPFTNCNPVSSESILVSWDAPPLASVNGLLQGYKVIYRPLGGDLTQVRERVTLPVNEIKLVNLQKYTNYSIEVMPYNRRGNGAPSKPVYCRTAEDVPGQIAELKTIISSADSAIISWKDPLQKNGVITKYTVSWRELNKNHTKTAITVPKTRTNVFSTRYRVPHSFPQYKLTGLVEGTPYEVWVTASTRLGEGPPTPVVSVLPTRSVPARILELGDTIVADAVSEFSAVALGCHSIGVEPIRKEWTSNGQETLGSLPMEVDGSLVVQTLDNHMTNFTCSVSNEFGSDEVTYRLIKESGKSTASVSVKATATSFNSAQITLARHPNQESGDGGEKGKSGNVGYATQTTRGYEIYYRAARPDSHEWQVKPIGSLDEGANRTIVLENLACGNAYQLYLVELETGSRTETVSFRTQGTAPVAPKKEEVLRLVNGSSIYIYPSAWDVSMGCPIGKLTVEYRSSMQYSWKLLSSRPLADSVDELLEIANLTPRSIYSVRMTAHSETGATSTMAEYEVRVGLEDEDAVYFGDGLRRAFIVDTTTIVSLASSCVVLVAGCIAVACLIAYKRKSTRKLSASSARSHYRRTSGATTATAISSHDELHQSSLGIHDPQHARGRPPHRTGSRDSILNASAKHSSANMQAISDAVSKQKSSQPVVVQQVLRVPNVANEQVGRRNSFNTSSQSPVRGKLPAVSIPQKQIDELEKDIYNEYDEITPYATFTLANDDDDAATEEEFKTFTVKIGEPAYCFKGSMDGVPTTSRDYKMGSCAKRDEHGGHYHCSAINTHSITSGSSNHTELMRAYDFGRRHFGQHRVQHEVQTHEIPHDSQHPLYYDESDEYGVKSSIASEADTPTDPGIRQFTKSPPRPNETRIGGCFTRGLPRCEEPGSDSPERSTSRSSSSTEEEGTSSSATPTNGNAMPVTQVFGAIPRDRSRKPTWSQAETAVRGRNQSRHEQLVEEEMRSAKTGLSSDDEIEEVKKSGHRRRGSKQSPSATTPTSGSGSGQSASQHRAHRGKSPSSSSRVKRPPIRTKSTADEIEC